MSNKRVIDEEREDHLVNDILDIYNGVWNNYDEYRAGKTQINYNIDIIRDMKLKFPNIYGNTTIPANHQPVLSKRIFDKVYSLGCADGNIRSKN